LTRYLSLAEVLRLHGRIIAETGGSDGLRDLGLLESALAQPRQTFGGQDLYPNLVEKAAAVGYSLIKNHPFVDGNKRIGHAVVEALLMLNGFELSAGVDESETEILAVAAGERSRDEFRAWIEASVVRLGSTGAI
jgi:death-on-curing protein